MAIPRPGDYITAKCRRCNDVTGHVVMLVLEGEIAKVECKACGSVHKYWGSGEPAAPKKQSPSMRVVKAGQTREAAKELGTPKAAKVTRTTAVARQKAALQKNESAWQEAMVRLSALSPQPYSMVTPFQQDDFVDHPTFGRGVVIAIIRPDKMEILFQEGVKVLRRAHE